MLVYRVVNAKYKASVLSGVGAEKFGGRWNMPGTKAVYCSENISLALLEYYVHSSNIQLLPSNILVAKIEIPKTFRVEQLERLPNGWNNVPYSSITTSIFTNRSINRDFFALKVPSTIVGLEHNIILNPLYRNFDKVSVKEFIQLPIDHRLKTDQTKT